MEDRTKEFVQVGKRKSDPKPNYYLGETDIFLAEKEHFDKCL